MQTIKKHIKCLGFFGILIMGFYACSRPETGIEDIKQIKNDEKSFYKEIFFGSVKKSKLNYVKNKIASRQEMSTEAIRDLEKVETTLTDVIEKIDPLFYEEFNRKIQSGDHILIEEALNQGGQMLEKSLYATPELVETVLLGEKIAKEVDINKFVMEDGTVDAAALNEYIEINYLDETDLVGPTFVVAAAYVVAAVSVAVTVNYAGAVNIYVWFNAWKWTNGPKKNTSPSRGASVESRLQLEKLINDIAIEYKEP